MPRKKKESRTKKKKIEINTVATKPEEKVEINTVKSKDVYVTFGEDCPKNKRYFMLPGAVKGMVLKRGEKKKVIRFTSPLKTYVARKWLALVEED